MRQSLMLVAVLSLIWGCGQPKTVNKMSNISEKTIVLTLDSVLQKVSNHSSTDTSNLVVERTLLEKGVRNAARYWTKVDGSDSEFLQFCVANACVTPSEKKALLMTVQRNLEVLYGNLNRISLQLKEPVQLTGKPITPLDETFGALDPYAHLTEDLFASKIAFAVLLNFPYYSLEEKHKLGEKWNRLEWAYARLGDVFVTRIPAALNQQFATALTISESYISSYNIRMDKLRTEDNNALFPDSLSLIAHWGLRDELKACYADANKGHEKQQMIYRVMLHIIEQTIPVEVIDKGDVTWKPYSNTVYKDGVIKTAAPEPNTRYERLLELFHASKALDPYCPNHPTALQRAFERDMEVSAAGIEALFTQLIGAPEVAQVANLIKQRLGRPLQPFDLWYDGFKARSNIAESVLTAKTNQKYPTTQAFERDMPNLLTQLGFSNQSAQEIASFITVDNARGSGHAWGAQMRTDKAHLRTRIQPGGMDYKGFNIAMHEFGHNVEQTISLHQVDHYILNGIPSTAFTEALAFVFQKRDLGVLGYHDTEKEKAALQTLDIFWGCYEIMGVSLVDLRTWKWLYEHPNATAEELKNTVIALATDLWNNYYAPYLGGKDSPLLAVYSHMIEYPLYLSNYPYGHLVEFQLEQRFGKELPGNEILRMYRIGRLTPDEWMKAAVNKAVAVEPMLEATATAVKLLKENL